MTQTPPRVDELKAQYRACWDAYMVLAHRNRELVRNGEKPTEEQIMEEERAVIAVELARSKLLAAISCLGR